MHAISAALPSTGRSSTPVLWPPCQITTASCQLQCPEPFTSKQREQAGPGHHHKTQVCLPGAAPAPQTNAPGLRSTCAGPTGFPKLPGIKAYTLLLHKTTDKKHERDCIEKAGELQELSREFSGAGGANEHRYFRPPPPP